MPVKRIILMYISEASGHHSATLAIERAIRIISPDSEILNINAFNYTNPISEKFVNLLYMNVIKRTPRVWDYLYDNPKIVKKIDSIKAAVHRFNSEKLNKLFSRFKPDCVVCTQAFPCGMVADFKKGCNSSLRLIAVLTDYIPHSFWVYDTVDYYITPSDEVSMRLQEKGIPAERIKVFGIPLDPRIIAEVTKDQIMPKLNLSSRMPTVLIMGGGQGLGPIEAIVQHLEKVPQDMQEIVVTGINKRLYKSLKGSIKKYRKRILLYHYAHNIDELMSVADMIITKPGGVTTAEALAKHLPMIIIRPIPGQEASNASYLMEKGAALKIDKIREIGRIIQDLLTEPDRLCRMRESAARISRPSASLDIAKFILA